MKGKKMRETTSIRFDLVGNFANQRLHQFFFFGGAMCTSQPR